MREFAKSMMRFTWSMTVFGTKQMFDLVRSQGRGEKMRETTDAFDNVTQATEGEMEDVTKSLFHFGDNLQKNMVDIMFSMMPFGNSGQKSVDGVMGNMFRQTADAMRKGMNLAQQSANSITNVVQDAGQPAAHSQNTSSGWGPPPSSGSSGNAGNRQTQTPPPPSGSHSSTRSGWGPMPTPSSAPNAKK